MTRFVFYGYWLPEARLAAVNILAHVNSSPSHQPALLATLTSSPAVSNMVLRTFSEALDAEDDLEDVDVPDNTRVDDGVMTRLVILDIFQSGLHVPASTPGAFNS